MIGKYFSALFFFIGFGTLHSQTTIFEVLDLDPAGCSLAAPRDWSQVDSQWSLEEVPDETIMEEEALPPPPTGYSDFQEIQPLISTWITQVKASEPDFLQGRIAWRDDMEFFLQGAQWGLRRKDGKVRIPPRFDHVVADTLYKGFVAYRDGEVNYYSVKGKRRLKDNYQRIEPLVQGGFVVETEQGFGLLDQRGKMLVTPEQQSIYPISGQRPYVRVRDAEDRYYLYHLPTGQSTYYPDGLYGFKFIGDRYAVGDQRDLIDFQENRSIFCSQAVNIEVLDREQGYLVINAPSAPDRRYLTDLQGRLLTREAFARVDAYLPTGHFIVRKKAVDTPNSPQHTGLIDTNGEWVTHQAYASIKSKLYAGRYLAATYRKREVLLLDLEGTTITPPHPYFHIEEDPDGEHLKLLWKEGGITKAAHLNLNTQEFTALDAPGYWGRVPLTCGNQTVYRAIGENGQMLLDAEDTPLLDEPAGFIMGGNATNRILVKRKKLVDGRTVNVDQQVDCSGQPVEDVPASAQTHQLTEGLLYVKPVGRTPYFQLADGTKVNSEVDWNAYSYAIGKNHFGMYDYYGRRGVVNRQGKTILPAVFDVIHFREKLGLLYASAMNTGTYFRADGTTFPGPEYTDVQYADLNLFRVQQDGRWGLMKRAGKLIVPTKYYRIHVGRGVITAFASGGVQDRFDLMGNELE